MQYYSTNKISPNVNFKDAVIKGRPADKGLYFPEEVPLLPLDFINSLDQYSTEEIAYEILFPYVKGIIPASEFIRMLMATFNFKIPLIKVSKDISSLELFHGPTLTFKDIGARFMSYCMEYFIKERDKKIIALVATTGDAGGAIANSFYDIAGIEVVILFPSGKLNMIQEKQLITTGINIHALEVDGSFEDCRNLVTDAFNDEELNNKITLCSAGSGNIARWLPQQLYYFLAYKQWMNKDETPVISIPSGNLGNLSAGLLASFSGLPVKHFIAANNANAGMHRSLAIEKNIIKKQVATLSQSMDIVDAVNFDRILELVNHKPEEIKKWISAYSISDSETKAAIKSVHQKNGYTLDPHTAVGYVALQQYIQEHPGTKGIVLATANPAKFFEVVEPVIDEPTSMPAAIELQFEKQKRSMKINNDVDVLKDFLFTIQ
jgi:threonine synthase